MSKFDSNTFLKTLTHHPGVYRMYDRESKVIYVGKAKNLKKRLSSYFCQKLISQKTKMLVSLIYQIDITITRTETEALLLEHNYIKFYKPRYNIILRDDKSYPFISLSRNPYPSLTMYRGNKNQKDEYFGPFPSSQVVRETLSLLQKIFPVRQCSENMFRYRSRPCLQYQIGRCLAPCVKNLVSAEEYEKQVQYVRLFLSGKNNKVLKILMSKMDQLSQELKFEKAAKIRDQIQTIRRITEKQFVSNISKSLDAVSIIFEKNIVCMHVLFIRQGKLLGSRSYFPEISTILKKNEVFEEILGQFYLQRNKNRDLPSEILLDFSIKNKNLLINSLKKISGQTIKIKTKPFKEYIGYLKIARINAASAIKTKFLQFSVINSNLNSLSNLLNLKKIKRIECFDISHTLGEYPIASCVVFNKNGPLRTDYRYYNIKGIAPGDDYAAINQALQRRYGKGDQIKKIPDVILIDGGKGHLNQARLTLSELHFIKNRNVPFLLSIEKGRHSKTGIEKIFLKTEENGLILPSNSPALHIIQHIRNEAHNYAISRHRKKREKEKNTSSLESIKGIGPKRRQILLKYMGGLQGLINSDIKNIAALPGISLILAKRVYYALRDMNKIINST